jgi:carboxymethylenebutenolidase
MQSSLVDIPTPDGVADAYLTRPDDDREHPAVLLLIDAIGLRPRIEEMADRIAERGYIVLAPNVFYRGGRAPVAPVPDFTDDESRQAFMQKLRPLMEELTPERVASDGGAYLDHLQQLTPGPVALTGYCMGGRLAFMVAAAHPDRVAAVGSFHAGGLVTEEPDSEAELYFGHADQDANMTPEQIAALEAALDEAGVTYTSELYEGAMHGYTMSDMAVYNEQAAERHFAELFALLDRALSTEAASAG